MASAARDFPRPEVARNYFWRRMLSSSRPIPTSDIRPADTLGALLGNFHHLFPAEKIRCGDLPQPGRVGSRGDLPFPLGVQSILHALGIVVAFQDQNPTPLNSSRVR